MKRKNQAHRQLPHRFTSMEAERIDNSHVVKPVSGKVQVKSEVDEPFCSEDYLVSAKNQRSSLSGCIPLNESINPVQKLYIHVGKRRNYRKQRKKKVY